MKKGFTLIELLITITVFSLITVTSLQLFSSAFKEQRKTLARTYLLSEASYATEYISRALRMAKKDLDGVCISAKHNFTLPSQDHVIFMNYNGECQEFFLENNLLKVKKFGVSQSLIPSNLFVENLKFEILGESQDDTLQPRVTFVLLLKTTEPELQELKLETTVSQRNLDVKY